MRSRRREPDVALRIDIITLFPEIFFGPLASSITGRAMRENKVEIRAIDLRDFTHDRRKTVDDKPFGGGPGMLMKVEPLFEAVSSLKQDGTKVILTGPAGGRFTQKTAHALSGEQHLIFICGHYEGVDQRVRDLLVDMELSIGDYILTNGNLAAMVMVDAIVRLLPGVLGDDESAVQESFENGLLEYPQYTQPVEFHGMRVPDVLLSGDHARIGQWRRAESTNTTLLVRPDLINNKN